MLKIQHFNLRNLCTKDKAYGPLRVDVWKPRGLGCNNEMFLDLNTTTTTDKRAESVPNSTLMPATPLPIPMPQNLVDTAGEECDLSAAWDDSWDFPLYRLDDRNGPVEGQKRSTLSSCCIEAMQTMVAENHRLAATNQHLVAEIEKLTDKLAKIPTVQKQEEKKDFPTP